MSEYEKDRVAAERFREAKKAELYLRCPELEKIDAELSEAGLALSRSMLSGKETAEALRDRAKELLRRRGELTAGLGLADDYDRTVYKCGICSDTGFDGSTRCACFKTRLVKKYYKMANLGKTFENENFDTFELGYYSSEIDEHYGVTPKANIKRIWEICLDFVKNFDTEFANLLMHGDTGLGKTFLCNCIAKELLDSGKTVLYYTAAQMFKIVEEIRFNRGENEDRSDFLDMLVEVDLLIIDDLGTEFCTVVTVSELFNCINTRLLDKKHTIISTNLSRDELTEQYSDRITSRFIGNYKMLRFFGTDIRIAKKYGLA